MNKLKMKRLKTKRQPINVAGVVYYFLVVYT